MGKFTVGQCPWDIKSKDTGLNKLMMVAKDTGRLREDTGRPTALAYNYICPIILFLLPIQCNSS